MCGIAGGMFWSHAVERADADAAVRAMVRSLAHRGPDGVGVYSPSADRSSGAPYVVFGHTRLAILDTSDAGAQPMTVENVHGRERAGRTGTSCITYNGETYNFRELRSELERS
jgi:asparagine synthase (glutamine-hydrolysing)